MRAEGRPESTSCLAVAHCSSARGLSTSSIRARSPGNTVFPFAEQRENLTAVPVARALIEVRKASRTCELVWDFRDERGANFGIILNERRISCLI